MLTGAADVLRSLVRRTPFYGPLRQLKLKRLHARWIGNGRPDPPSHVFKQGVVREYAERYRLRAFVETGTYLGDMIYAVRDSFDEIHSIELNAKFCAIARRRFSRAPHVTIVPGDSGEVLGAVLGRIDGPCLFWLDGHYTAGKYAIKGDRETPIELELRHIAAHPHKRRHVILIDDARDFTGSRDYPDIETLRQWADREGYDGFEIERNIIRIFSRTI